MFNNSQVTSSDRIDCTRGKGSKIQFIIQHIEQYENRHQHSLAMYHCRKIYSANFLALDVIQSQLP